MAFDYKSELYRYRHYYQQIEPQLKKPETKAYTMIVLSFFTISFFGLFAIRPTLTTITSLTREIDDNTFVSDQLDEKISDLILAQESYQAIQDDLPLIYASVPQTPEFPALLIQLEDVAREFNASISALQFQQLPLSPLSLSEITESSLAQLQSAQPFSFTISLKADYPRIIQFLNRLIGVNRLIIINQVEISGTQDTAELQLNLLLNSFYLPSL